MRSVLVDAHMQAIESTPFPMKISFIACILPDRGTHLYKRIKSVAELDLGFITQCVVKANIAKGPSYCGGVALKVILSVHSLIIDQHEAWWIQPAHQVPG